MGGRGLSTRLGGGWSSLGVSMDEFFSTLGADCRVIHRVPSRECVGGVFRLGDLAAAIVEAVRLRTSTSSILGGA